MPADTLQIRYSPSVRPNCRRVRHPILRAVATLLVWVVALLVLIGILMKIGFLQNTNGEVRLGILAQGGVAARLQEFTSAALLFLALHPNYQAINIAPL